MSDDSFTLTAPRCGALDAVQEDRIEYGVTTASFYDGDDRLTGSIVRTLRDLRRAGLIHYDTSKSGPSPRNMADRGDFFRPVSITSAGQALLDSGK